jgi:hypothetical protein
MAGSLAARKQQDQQVARSMGLEGAPAGNLDDIGMAGGGIVAFSTGDLVGGLTDEEKEQIAKNPYLQEVNLMNKYFTSQGMGQQSPEVKAISENIADIRKNFGDDYDTKNLFNAITAGGIGAVKGKSQNFLENIGGGLEAGFGQYMKGETRKEDMMNKLRSGEIDLAKLTSTERNNLLRSVTDAAGRTEDRRIKGLEAKERLGDRNFQARLGAYTKNYDKIIGSMIDKIGVRKMTDADYQKAHRLALDAADAQIEAAQGKKPKASDVDPAAFDRKKS